MIETKFHPPERGSRNLERPALEGRLTRFCEKGGVVTIVAPAGSGKSSMMASLYAKLDQKAMSCHWLSLDSGDDDPVPFTRYFIRSFRTLAPGFADRQLALLNSSGAQDVDAVLEAVLTFLSSWPERAALFLDDTQFLTNPRLLRFFNRLLTYLPPTMVLVFGSRVQMPIRLERRRVSGTLMEITAAELNLAPGELVDFMAQVHALTLPAEDAEVLHNTTEGWIAGLQLAALACAHGPRIDSAVIGKFSGRDRNLSDYLFRAVFETLPDAVGDFLVQTASLSRMNAPLCDAVTGKGNAREMLADLEQRNLFLIPLDRRRHWFRYHHLFADYLQELFAATPAKVQQSLLLRAGEWCEANGELTDAIQYFLDGQHFERAAKLVSANAERVALYQGDHSTILDWVKRLPAEYVDGNPELLLHHAWSSAFTRDVPTAFRLSQRAVTLLGADEAHLAKTAAERSHLLWLARVIEVIATAADDDLDTAQSEAQKLIAQLPEAEPVLAASTLNVLAYCRLVSMQLPGVVEAATEAYRRGTEGASVYTTVWADYFRGMAHIEMGRLSAAKECADRAEMHAGPLSKNNCYISALRAILQANIAMQRGLFDESRDLLLSNKVFSSLASPIEAIRMALVCEARQLAWQGQLSAARRALQDGQDAALATRQHRLYVSLAAEEVDLQLQFDDEQSARNTAARTNLFKSDQREAEGFFALSVREPLGILEILVDLRAREAESALRRIDQLQRLVTARDHITLQVQLMGLRSSAHWLAGAQTDALKALNAAVELARPEELTYPLIRIGEPLVPVLEAWLANARYREEDSRQFVRRMYELLGGEDRSAELKRDEAHISAQSVAIEPLTQRELEILQLISTGLDNKELAARSFISVSTVKWHLSNIFSKLGVRSRMAAVVAAQHRGLI